VRQAVISRGVSGSGKSTFNRKVTELAAGQGLKVAVHCTDDLFMVNGRYNFNPVMLGRNHAMNLENFIDSLGQGIDIVVCDNTNTSKFEWSRYAKAAQDAGYALVDVYFEPGDIDDHDKRNTHRVPREILEKQKQKLISSRNACGLPEGFTRAIVVKKDFFPDNVREAAEWLLDEEAPNRAT